MKLWFGADLSLAPYAGRNHTITLFIVLGLEEAINDPGFRGQALNDPRRRKISCLYDP